MLETAVLDPLAALLDAAPGARLFDLAVAMEAGMPQSPNHPEYRMALQRRHGDMVRADGGSAANEVIVTGGHVGTHIDALAHVSHCGELYGGVSAADAVVGGRFASHGVETIEPFFCRGVLFDVPAALGVDVLPGGYEVTVDDLSAALSSAGVAAPGPGEVALVRTGWGSLWSSRDAYIGRASGVPGPGEAAARWLASLGVRATGADTIAYECIPAGAGHALLPAHRVLLVESGVHIIETMALESLAAAGVHEFLFVLAPLKLVGATGSPCRPLAVAAA